MENTYYFIIDTNQNIVGCGMTPDGTVPFDSVVCTQEQYQNAGNWSISEGQIVPNPNLLANTQTAQVQSLSNACAMQILSGFTSSALGSVNNYASKEVDQRNLTQSAQSLKGGLLSCQNAAGVWSRQLHTQAQSQQALEDFVTARDAARLKLQTYEAQIAAATTVAQVQAILWAGTP